MGNFNKRISLFFIYLTIFFILTILLSCITIMAQEAEPIYIETLTISLDSQELLKLEEEIIEIPIDFEIINLSENFLSSYEQLSLNLIQFKYDSNYYIFNIFYTTLLGYGTSLYYSSNYGITYFQGFNSIEVYPYLSFYGFHFFHNNLEIIREFLNWSLDFIFNFKSYNLPKTDGLSNFGAIYTDQRFKGINNNISIELALDTLSLAPTYQNYLIEKAKIDLLFQLYDNIYSTISFYQYYAKDFGIRAEASLLYNFDLVDFEIGFSYDPFFNKFYGMIQFYYSQNLTKIILKIEKDSDYQFIFDKYAIYDTNNFSFYSDYFDSSALFKFSNDTFSISLDLQYLWFWKKPLKIYEQQLMIYKIYTIENIWYFLTSFNIEWKIDEKFSVGGDFDLILPSFYVQNLNYNQKATEKILGLNLFCNMFISKNSNLRFSLYSEILRNFLGVNNPIFNLNIDYNIEKKDIDIKFYMTINIFQYFILPEVKSSILTLGVSSQFYF